MRNGFAIRWNTCVALRKESVDRNNRPHSQKDINRRSLSARRAWIEILAKLRPEYFLTWSLSARRAWIEILLNTQNRHLTKSLSARRAWIEIVCEMRCFCVCVVALRKESVDRNRLFIIGQYLVSVALRKESVDRNRTPHHMNTRPIPSLSARRAWIEISGRAL